MNRNDYLRIANAMLSAVPGDIEMTDGIIAAAYALGGAIALARQHQRLRPGGGGQLMRGCFSLVEEIACTGIVTAVKQ